MRMCKYLPAARSATQDDKNLLGQSDYSNLCDHRSYREVLLQWNVQLKFSVWQTPAREKVGAFNSKKFNVCTSSKTSWTVPIVVASPINFICMQH